MPHHSYIDYSAATCYAFVPHGHEYRDGIQENTLKQIAEFMATCPFAVDIDDVLCLWDETKSYPAGRVLNEAERADLESYIAQYGVKQESNDGIPLLF